MTYLISTEVSGFTYYAKVVNATYPIKYSWQGLKNNATEFSNKHEPESIAIAISRMRFPKCKTPLQVIPKN